tara:strand:- start:187 stop:588 length:402 start_codon:yes stop_codon:yes gene_type:complete
MAIQSTGKTFDIGAISIYDSDIDEVIRKDILGGSGVLFSVMVTNPHADASHLYLYDATEPVVGTTDVDWSLPIPGSATIFYTFTDGAGGQGGVAFSNLSVACVKEVGVADGPGGSGSTAPTGTNILKMTLKAT